MSPGSENQIPGNAESQLANVVLGIVRFSSFTVYFVRLVAIDLPCINGHFFDFYTRDLEVLHLV